MCGKDHDRQVDLPLAQRGLQLETGHARHAQVREDATGPVCPVGLDERFGIREQLGAYAFEGQQQG